MSLRPLPKHIVLASESVVISFLCCGNSPFKKAGEWSQVAERNFQMELRRREEERMQQVSFVSWPAWCACYSCDLCFTNVLLSVGLHNALVMKVIHCFGFNNHGNAVRSTGRDQKNEEGYGTSCTAHALFWPAFHTPEVTLWANVRLCRCMQQNVHHCRFFTWWVCAFVLTDHQRG